MSIIWRFSASATSHFQAALVFLNCTLNEAHRCKQCCRNKEFYSHSWKAKDKGNLLVKAEFVKSLHRCEDKFYVVFPEDFNDTICDGIKV